MENGWPRKVPARDGREIVVRHVAYGDAPALHISEHMVASEGIYLGVEPAGIGDLKAVIERVRACLMDSRAAQLVAELDQELVGSVAVRPGPYGDKDRHWRSLVVWVVPEHRGNGIGRALLSSALDWMRSQGLERAIIEVFGSNAAACALFRKSGFVEEGRQEKLFLLPGIGHVDNLLMVLDLES